MLIALASASVAPHVYALHQFCNSHLPATTTSIASVCAHTASYPQPVRQNSTAEMPHLPTALWTEVARVAEVARQEEQAQAQRDGADHPRHCAADAPANHQRRQFCMLS